MTAPLLYQNRARVRRATTCRRCTEPIERGWTAYRFTSDTAEVWFHPTCQPGTDHGVPHCPSCYQRMIQPSWWADGGRRRVYGTAKCVSCRTAGDT